VDEEQQDDVCIIWRYIEMGINMYLYYIKTETCLLSDRPP
jgi:hypothetical protein